MYKKNVSEWLSVNPKNESSPNFSILDTLGDAYRIAGKLTFRIVWPKRDGANYNIWKQTTNPVTQKIKVVGYEPVDVRFKDNG